MSTSKPRSANASRDHLLAAVVAVLADLGDQDARPAAFVGLELGDELLHPRDGFRHGADLPLVDAGDRLDLGAVPAEHLLQRRRDFAHRRLGARGVDGEREQVAVATGGVARQRRQRLRDRLRIALALEAAKLVDLQLPHRRIVDLEQIDRGLLPGTVLVDADDRLLAGVDARLRLRRGLLDAQLRQAASIAFAMPPISSTSWMWPQAVLASS